MRTAFALAIAIAASLPLTSLHAAVPEAQLEEYGRGIIEDYSDLEASEAMEWIWLEPGLDLSAHQFNVERVENLTLLVDADMEEVLEQALPKVLARAGSRDADAPVLTVEAAVFWAQRANRAKRWIPYAGDHLSQSGVGLELVMKNAEGEIVGKIRHSGREGDELKAAAQELMDDVAAFIHAG